ncbi:MAG: hypothetical protein Q8O30_09030 [Candidatus Omnitrophota bacterium]|nr:hypothetical protein [Candidatus Omnitrophota bacterium]
MLNVLRTMALKYRQKIFNNKKDSWKILLLSFAAYFFLMVGYGIIRGLLNNDLPMGGDQLFYRISGYSLSRGLGYTFDGITSHGMYQIGYPLFFRCII